jgi:hypothetical protein
MEEEEQWQPDLLPVARQVAAQTIGLDLVAVQPLDLPVGNLMFFDPFEQTRKIFFGDIDELLNDITFDDYGYQNELVNNARLGF